MKTAVLRKPVKFKKTSNSKRPVAVPKKPAKVKAAMRVKTYLNPEIMTHVTHIRIRDNVEVATIDGYLRFWIGGREVRIGPLTPDQAEKLCEDLGYDAVA